MHLYCTSKAQLTEFMLIGAFVETGGHVVGATTRRLQFTANVEIELIIFEAVYFVAIILTQWTQVEGDVIVWLGNFAIFSDYFLWLLVKWGSESFIRIVRFRILFGENVTNFCSLST